MTRPAPVLPMETVRFFREEFRAARAGMAASRNHPDYLRWRSIAHNCQWRVKELRREFPRKRLPRTLEA